MLVSDRRLAGPERLAEVALAIGAAGLRLAVQLREKDLGAAALLAMGRRLVQALRERDPDRRVLLSVNGRFDVALAAGADGVHLPADGPPVGRVREAVGSSLVVGVSTHAPWEVRRAAGEGADYALFGPVFETPSKAGRGSPQGIHGLAAAVRAGGTMPVLAVGGIDPGSAARCRRAGAHGVAVIRALLAAEDPLDAARRLLADVPPPGAEGA